ncbi:transposase family protein [Mycobacterium ulcerans str. Harvey]|uniref:Transposase family protein n=1 Tax=Mycobacterium ulcerans str. Harvey TaxID=1299332 RepID=A0ABP3ACM8_MYCUL|nr:transposase family protein [Mycobacterium ulcerans str. Harvey]
MPSAACRSSTPPYRDHDLDASTLRIENSLHWIRDVTFDEDRQRPHTGNGAQVLATLRNRDQSAPPQRRRQHRRSLPDHRFDRQPPPRPPQSTIPQLTSLLINNAGALSTYRTRQGCRSRSGGRFSRHPGLRRSDDPALRLRHPRGHHLARGRAHTVAA